jgi:hypothetical protein
MPETLAMRPFDYLSDAGAVAWNPAMLGARNHFDIAFLGEFSSFASATREVYGSFGFFAKFSGIAIGYAKNLAMRSSSGELYLGAGFPIVDNLLWGGASGRLSMEEPRARFDFAASLLARPLPYLIVGATATTMRKDYERSGEYVRKAEGRLQFSGGVQCALSSDWSVFATVRSASLQEYWQDKPLPAFDIGGAFHLWNSTLVASAAVQYSFGIEQAAARVGVEVNTDLLRLGAIVLAPAAAPAYSETRSVLRFSTDQARSLTQLREMERADANLCFGEFNPRFAESSVFAESLPRINKYVAQSLEETGFLDDPASLYALIRRQFYDVSPPGQRGECCAKLRRGLCAGYGKKSCQRRNSCDDCRQRRRGVRLLSAARRRRRGASGAANESGDGRCARRGVRARNLENRRA